MKQILGFATGTIWEWAMDEPAKVVDYAMELDVSAVELTLGFKKDLYKFQFRQRQIEWLRGLKFVSIHAPFDLLTSSVNKKDILEQLDFMQNLYRDMNAKNLIIHPLDIPSPDVLENYDFRISTENLPHFLGDYDLEELFELYPDMGLCVDVSHAYVVSKDETRRLINSFGDRITEVHLSGTYRRRDHQSLRRVTPSFIESIKPIRELDVPILLEGDFGNKNMDFVKEEMDVARNLLK